MSDHWLRTLNVPGWEARFSYVLGGQAVEEAVALRWEQWIVAGDLYVYRTREAENEPWGPVLGWGLVLGGRHGNEAVVPDLATLRASLMAWLSENEDPPFVVSTVHPVLKGRDPRQAPGGGS
jgi:hypothetical protein